jgi:uncharacterized membrane protein (DUF106 family)
MTFHEDVDDTNARSRFNARSGFFRRKLFLAMVIALFVIIIFFIWFFFVSESNNAVILPPNCYSVNGEQICTPAKP